MDRKLINDEIYKYCLLMQQCEDRRQYNKIYEIIKQLKKLKTLIKNLQ